MSNYCKGSFLEERSAFVRVPGRPTDRLVGRTACSSGPTNVRIGHDVLSLAHARIGGWIGRIPIRFGGDASPERFLEVSSEDNRFAKLHANRPPEGVSQSRTRDGAAQRFYLWEVNRTKINLNSNPEADELKSF